MHHHARQNFNCIRFITLCCELGLSWLALVEIGLNLRNCKFNAWRATINHTANRYAMAFSPSGNSE